MRLIWCPQWYCQNYPDSPGLARRCPYCPLGFSEGRLLFHGRTTASNHFPPLEDTLGFFRRNAEVLGRQVELSGGEPLLYPHLVDALGTLIDEGWTWAITSNTLCTSTIERLLDRCGGGLDACRCWTASYHPLSDGDEAFAHNIRLIREHASCILNSTVVICEETLPRLPAALHFLSTLPLSRVQFHIDVFRPADRSSFHEGAAELGQEIPVFMCDPFPPGVRCHRFGHSLVLAADGTLYECMTKAFQDIDPIATACANLRLEQLRSRVEACPLVCYGGCDQAKHVRHRLSVDHP